MNNVIQLSRKEYKYTSENNTQMYIIHSKNYTKIYKDRELVYSYFNPIFIPDIEWVINTIPFLESVVKNNY